MPLAQIPTSILCKKGPGLQYLYEGMTFDAGISESFLFSSSIFDHPGMYKLVCTQCQLGVLGSEY